MNEEDLLVYTWVKDNLDTMIDFYQTLHIYNLVNIKEHAKDGIRHFLIPDSWPMDSRWGLELLYSSISGVMKVESMQKRWLNWLEN